MTLEQQMKAALDGNFWFFTHDNRIECRKVSIGHIPNHHANEYRRPQIKNLGRPLRPLNPNRWSAQNSEWLKANYKTMSIGRCAKELGFPYTTVYRKITALRWKEYDGKQ